MPANAQNKDNAKKFLEFVAQAENIEAIAGAIKTLPTHKDAAPLDDRFLKKGKSFSCVEDCTIHDRDTTPEMASAGMQGFQDFMLNPDDMMDILKR